MTRPTRPSKPCSPLHTSAMGSGGSAIKSPETPRRQSSTGEALNKIARPEHTTVPPSPGVPGPSFEGPESPTGRLMRRLKAHTGAGVQKHSAKKATRPSLQVKTDASAAAKVRNRGGASFFRFMDLPGGTDSQRQRKVAKANFLQKFATRYTSTRMSITGRLFLFIDRGWLLCVPARVLIEDVPCLRMSQVMKTTRNSQMVALLLTLRMKRRRTFLVAPTAHSGA